MEICPSIELVPWSLTQMGCLLDIPNLGEGHYKIHIRECTLKLH